MMTDEELQEAITDANKDLAGLRSPLPSGPLPQPEVRHREMILLRQVTAYKIQEAKNKGDRESELFNTAIYNLMTSFVKSHK